MAGALFIGTSGWAYKAWAKAFYPPGLDAAQELEFYAERFDTVEVNATFYRLPSAAAVANWRRRAPKGFIYAVKGSRSVTHYFRLKEGAKSFDLLIERARALGPHAGPLLWQLPRDFARDDARLAGFLERLPRDLRHAIELRHESWLVPEVFALLARHGVAHVALSAAWFPKNTTLTADFTYVRFHGLSGGAAHDYTRRELVPWAKELSRCVRRGVDVYAYFNNDVNVRAPYNAMMLRELVSLQREARGRAER